MGAPEISSTSTSAELKMHASRPPPVTRKPSLPLPALRLPSTSASAPPAHSRTSRQNGIIRGRRASIPEAIPSPEDKPWSLGMDHADKTPAMVYGPSRGRRRTKAANPDAPLYNAQDIMGRWKPMALRKMTGVARYQLPLTWGNTLEDKLMS